MKVFSSAAYVATLPAGHVFPMSKFSESAQAIRSGGIADVIDPGVIADVDLYRVHTKDYVHSIRTGEYNELTRLRLGLPWHPTISTRSHAATAGTLAAARTALVEGISANLAGGTHHAFPDRGEGFCVFNDVAVAIRALQHDEPMIQVLVVDLDAHQGNATHAIFRNDPSVYCYSMHVGRNYPSRKEPGDMDVELDRFVSGDVYLERLRATLPGVVKAFEPDIAFYIAGADVHRDDRFGQMMLSSEQMRERDGFAIRTLRQSAAATVVVYGGGYNKTPGVTGQLHVQTIKIAAGSSA